MKRNEATEQPQSLTSSAMVPVMLDDECLRYGEQLPPHVDYASLSSAQALNPRCACGGDVLSIALPSRFALLCFPFSEPGRSRESIFRFSRVCRLCLVLATVTLFSYRVPMIFGRTV